MPITNPHLVALSAAVAGVLLTRRALHTRRLRRVRALASSSGYTAIVVGAGYGGLIAAKRLADVGVSYEIFEAQPQLGGTWFLNTYPECACDVPVSAYSPSFFQESSWSAKWAPQREILAYMHRLAKHFEIHDHITFNSVVESATFDGSLWTVTVRHTPTNTLTTHRANFFIAATGQLNNPAPPPVADAASFTGEAAFHTARWRHDVDLTDKVVACVGTGASAIQALPAIAPLVKHLYVFQRTAAFVIPRNNYKYGRLARFLLSIPLFRFIYRDLFIFGLFEALWWIAIRGAAKEQPASNKVLSSILESEMKKLAPPALWSSLRPSERLGCKRSLIADDWLPMFARPNVTLIPEAAARLVDGNTLISSKSGKKIGPLDVIIWANGFDTSKFLPGIDVRVVGRKESLHETWGDVPSAYYGITVAGFPNLAILYGPNTNQSNTSVISYLEAQMNHVCDLICKVVELNAKSFDVKKEAFDANVEREHRLAATTSFAADCDSWYKRGKNAVVVNNYHGPMTRYWMDVGWGINWEDYHVV